MRKSVLLCVAILASTLSAFALPARASEEAPEFCQTFKTAQDYKGLPAIRWDQLFLRCVRHTIGDGSSVDPTIFDIVYRTALQHQNGIRNDRAKALEYYELLLRDQNRDWREIVSHRVDEYGAELTSLGYPYKSNAQVLADIEQKFKDFEREVSGRREISVGDVGKIEIPEDLSIGQKFVAIIGAAIVADIARGLAGESTPQNVQDVQDKFNEHQRYIEERETSTWNHAASATYLP